MRRIAILSAALFLALCSTAHAADVTENTLPEILPVERSSSGVFEALQPLLNARVDFENGRYQESYKNYSAAFLHDPDNIEVLFGLAESALAIGKTDMASKAFTRLATYELDSQQAIDQFSGLVLAEVAAGESEKSEIRLKQALEIAPEDFRLWNALGQDYDKQQRWAESWAAYQQAAKVGFSQAGLHNNLGMSFLAQKKYKGAISHFKYAVRLAPKNSQVENNYRFALLMAGEYRAALANVDDDQAGALLSDAGYIALQREEFTLARALLEKAIEVSPRYNQQAIQNLEKLEARQN